MINASCLFLFLFIPFVEIISLKIYIVNVEVVEPYARSFSQGVSRRHYTNVCTFEKELLGIAGIEFIRLFVYSSQQKQRAISGTKPWCKLRTFLTCSHVTCVPAGKPSGNAHSTSKDIFKACYTPSGNIERSILLSVANSRDRWRLEIARSSVVATARSATKTN